MRIRIGYEIAFESFSATPMILMLSVHPSRLEDLLEPHGIIFDPPIPTRTYIDHFGNICTRIVAPPGRFTISSDNVVYDSGQPDVVAPSAEQLPVEDLPDDALEFLLGSRYCETDRLSDTAWSIFGRVPPGWGRVQAICDYVHDRLAFSYPDARSTRTAWEGHQERLGVCRDFAHLAIAFCRLHEYSGALLHRLPRRYRGASSPRPHGFQCLAYLEGCWYTFDARHNTPRIGRILMARGRDAGDVALSTSFGPKRLTDFRVVTDEQVVGYTA
jgi:transglutaminase-like putative cysteine protease